MEDFNKPKIYWAELARTGNSFVYDTNHIFAIAGVFILTMSKEYQIKYGYEYLTMFLNCPLSLFIFDMIYSKLDDTGWQWKKEPIEKLPIPKLPIAKQSQLLMYWQKLAETADIHKKKIIIAKISLEIYKILNLSYLDIEAIYLRTKVFNEEWLLIQQLLKNNEP